MVKFEKFEVNIFNGSTESILDAIPVKIDLLDYTDGSIRVKVIDIDSLRPLVNSDDSSHGQIRAHLESMDDLMIVAQIKYILENTLGIQSVTLVDTGTLYTRHDRVMMKDKSDAHGAGVYAWFVNSIGFTTVTLFDAHSNEIVSRIKNCVNIQQRNLVAQMWIRNDLPLRTAALVCPDAGARKKVANPQVVCEKTRNPETGKLTNFRIDKSQSIDPVDAEFRESLLVIDDICEGGGTFMGVVDCLNEFYKGVPCELYITHGICSNNAISRLLVKYRKIYVYVMKESVYNALSDKCKAHVVVNTLITGI